MLWGAGGGLSASAAGGLLHEVRQQCAGQLAFVGEATAKGSLSNLRTGTTDSEPPLEGAIGLDSREPSPWHKLNFLEIASYALQPKCE